LLPWVALTIAVALAALVPSAQAVPAYYEPKGLDWEAVTQEVVDLSAPRDGIIVYAPTVMRPYLYYLERLGAKSDAPAPIYPSYGWAGFSKTRFSPRYRSIVRDARRHDNVWLLLGYANDRPRRKENRRLQSALTRACGPAEIRRPKRLLLYKC
jgi:hypothetical protein